MDRGTRGRRRATVTMTSVYDERAPSKGGVRHATQSSPGRYSNRGATILRDDKNSSEAEKSCLAPLYGSALTCWKF